MNYCDAMGTTALMLAARFEQCVQLLLSYSASVDVSDSSAQSCDV